MSQTKIPLKVGVSEQHSKAPVCPSVRGLASWAVGEYLLGLLFVATCLTAPKRGDEISEYG